MLSVLSSKPSVSSVHRTFCICPREYMENELFPYHCLIVKCRGTYKQQALSNSRTRKFYQNVLQEQFLFTSGGWCIHLKKNLEIKEQYLLLCIFDIFLVLSKIQFFIIFFNDQKRNTTSQDKVNIGYQRI